MTGRVLGIIGLTITVFAALLAEWHGSSEPERAAGRAAEVERVASIDKSLLSGRFGVSGDGALAVVEAIRHIRY